MKFSGRTCQTITPRLRKHQINHVLFKIVLLICLLTLGACQISKPDRNNEPTAEQLPILIRSKSTRKTPT